MDKKNDNIIYVISNDNGKYLMSYSLGRYFGYEFNNFYHCKKYALRSNAIKAYNKIMKRKEEYDIEWKKKHGNIKHVHSDVIFQVEEIEINVTDIVISNTKIFVRKEKLKELKKIDA